MRRFQSGTVGIAFIEDGDPSGEPILLIHGFSSNHRVNWVETGWVALLVGQGRRVIALDNRGHGQSDKPTDPAQYTSATMAEDARGLLDHLGIGAADIVGYSMGAHIGAHLAIAHPKRVRSAIFGGLAGSMITGLRPSDHIIAGFLAPSLDEVTDPEARSYREFAMRTGGDLPALVACMRAGRPGIAVEDLRRIAAPVLVVVGETDAISGTADALADVLPHGQAVTVPRRGHMSTVGSDGFKAAVTDFLDRRP